MKKRKESQKSGRSPSRKSSKKEVFSASKNLLKGIYKQLKGFGFVDILDEYSGLKKGYFVHETKKGDAFEGDEVLFDVQVFRGREEAIIKKVTKRTEHLIVGTLKIGKNFAFVIPENNKGGKDIFIPGKHIGGKSDGSRVAVEILKWEGKNPEGRIIETFVGIPQGREDIYKIAFEMGARKSFSAGVQKQVHEIQRLHTKNFHLDDRRDFSALLTYTIDGAESKDLDDALSIEKISNIYRLYVHIADVSHFVEEHSLLDKEAQKRATSIYLVDQVIPMLPPEISNGVCSLHPGEKKYTVTCVIDIDTAGNVKNSYVCESVIESNHRLTYQEIDQIFSKQKPQLEGETLQFGSIYSQDLQKNIFLLKELSDILTKNSKKRGGLEFDFPETKINLDARGVPISYTRFERYDSYKIIEECMVLANSVISKMFSPGEFLYRIHEAPDGEDIEKCVQILNAFSGSKDAFSHKSLQEILAELQASPTLQYFQKMLLRSLPKAQYSHKNLGHFGLGLRYYSHFTSPIRRYADLQIHRIIKESLFKKMTPEKKAHYKNILPGIAQTCSEKSQKAEKMEYLVQDMLACKFMQGKEGNRYTGNISGIIEKGCFVELENTIEGFVPFENTLYAFDTESFCAQHISSGETLYFGSCVEVELKAVDFDTFRIQFAFCDPLDAG